LISTHAVRAHVTACARCNAIVHHERLVPPAHPDEDAIDEAFDPGVRLDGRLERLGGRLDSQRSK
jgi:hypothetical protein